jgi:hypothetical protein
MISNLTLDDLVSRIYSRRPLKSGSESSIPPYVLFLGSGCSIAAGVPTLPKLAASAMQMFGIAKSDAKTDDELVERFLEAIGTMKKEQVARMLQTIFAVIPIPSFYQQLAQLVRERFFPLIITTSYDTLLEQALDAVGFRSFDYRVTTFVQGSPVSTSTGGGEVVHIIKLHGDLAREVVHFTPDAVQQALRTSRVFMKSELRGDLIMVGYQFDDDPINSWLSHDSQRELWWVAPDQPENSLYSSWGVERHELTGSMGNPSIFFSQLSLRLLSLSRFGVRTAAYSDTAQSPDDVSLAAAFSSFSPPDDSLTETLRGEIRRAQTVLDTLEQAAPASMRPPDIQAQITYQKRQMSSLEEKIWSLPDVKPQLIQIISTIRDDLHRAHDDGQNSFRIDENLQSYLGQQVDAVKAEMAKEKPDRFIISASLSATLALADRVWTEYGENVIQPEHIRQLAALAPLAAAKVVM